MSPRSVDVPSPSSTEPSSFVRDDVSPRSVDEDSVEEGEGTSAEGLTARLTSASGA